MILFLMLSFLATSYGRAEQGFTQAFTPRYKVYSNTYFLLNISLYLNHIKRGKLILGVVTMAILVFTMSKHHSRNLPRIEKRKIVLEYGLNHFSFSEQDTVELLYPNQRIPRLALKESAKLGIFSNDHIDELLKKAKK